MSASMKRALLAGTAAFAVGLGGHAQAQTTTGTRAGTDVSNTAQATYTVNGTTQTTQSNTATFKVDRKVNLSVIKNQTADTPVNQGDTGAVTKFRVTNLTNDVQDILLDPDQNLGSVVYVGTDNFDMTNLRAYVDSNNNNEYDPGVDVATYIDELRPDASVTVFLVGNVPSVGLEQMAIVNLHATVAAGGQQGVQGAALIPTDLNTINQDNQVDVVFADDDSDGPGRDLARDGQARAYLAYVVTTSNVALTVTKSSRIISDGVNTLNPKALPGAVVEYCLAVRNATLGTAANNVTLTDLVPDNTTYVPGSLSIGGLGGTCVLNGEAQDDDADDANDGKTYQGSFDATAGTGGRVTAIIPRLGGGLQLNASFRVTIK